MHLKKVSKEKTQPLDSLGKYGRRTKYSVGGQGGSHFRGTDYRAGKSSNVVNEGSIE